MKISDIKGEAVVDFIADIIEPVANIATDPKTRELFEVQTIPDGADKTAVAAARLKAAVPSLIKSHRGDVIAILAAVNGETADEYANGLTVAKLMGDLLDVFRDPDIVGFFTSQAVAPATDGGYTSTSTSGDAPLALV
jgi:hypothetical protein